MKTEDATTDALQKPAQRDPAARRDLGAVLVAEALDMLAAEGVEALSLRALARRAGVSAMAPYRHFSDKDALLAAVATRGFEGLRAAMDAAGCADPRADLARIGVAYVTYALEHPALYRLMFGPRGETRHPCREAAGEAAYARLADSVARAFPEAASEALVLGCWSLTHGLAGLFLDGPLAARAGDRTEIAARVTRAMLGLGRHDTVAQVPVDSDGSNERPR